MQALGYKLFETTYKAAALSFPVILGVNLCFESKFIILLTPTNKRLHIFVDVI